MKHSAMPSMAVTSERENRAVFWLPVVLLTCAALLTGDFLPPWGTMLLATLALWTGFKWLVWQNALQDLRRESAGRESAGRRTCGRRILSPNAARAAIHRRKHSLLQRARRAFWRWLGMDPLPFLREGLYAPPAAPSSRRWTVATANTLIGAAIAWGVARSVPHSFPVVQAWAFLFGLGLFAHCGLVQLSAYVWRQKGIDVEPIMNRPLASTSLAVFWSRRWNTAFRDLAHRVVFQPVSRRYGPRLAIVAVFLFSGLVHDVAISTPAGGGYGLPTAYFLLQVVAQKLQRTRMARRWHIAGGAGGWLFTAAVVIAPAGLLFHRPFLENVVLPLMDVVGAR